MVVFVKRNCLKNNFINLVTLSIPKVAKNGQKVPNFADFEYRCNAFDFLGMCSLCDNMLCSNNDFVISERDLHKKKS